MLYKYNPVILILFFVVNSFSLSSQNEKSYIEDNGLLREYLESVDKSKTYDYTSNECNQDNNIYLPGKEFIYSITYTKNTDTLCIAFEKGSWKIYPTKSINGVQRVGLKIIDGNIQGMTKCKFNYYTQEVLTDVFEAAGIIENDKNVWIHPPRSRFFRILEINPFPYIKSPYSIGTNWKWSLEIGDAFANRHWKSWQGLITNDYHYEIIDQKNIQSKLGILNVYIIKGTAKSRIGQTELTSYFNPQYGFIKLEYTNIDGSIIQLELIEVINN